MNFKAIDLYLQELQNGKKRADSINDIRDVNVDDADIADYLEDIKRDDEKKFFDYLNSLPLNIKAQTFMELPTAYQIDLILKSEPKDLADMVETLDSDDAADLMIAIEKVDEKKEKVIFELLSDKRQSQIERLLEYSEKEAGSLMQIELFKIKANKLVSDALNKLAKLKENGVNNVQYLFVTDQSNKLLKAIAMDDLILEHRSAAIESIIDKYPVAHAVSSRDSIETAMQYIEKYDITTLPVVDRMGHLIGRITHDDIVDAMQKSATRHIYSMNKVGAEEEINESFAKTSKTRASWLGINLINAIIASLVIGIFERTIDELVALAILLPIVANMAGTASVQTMTVIIRQMSLGEIDYNDIKPFMQKEFSISFLNGILFGFGSALIAQLWFHDQLVSLAMGLSMFVSFISAGLLGVLVPLGLKKINFDPAVASSVIVITLVDIIGFFSFLGFATVIIF
jgi:magnesium transporter